MATDHEKTRLLTIEKDPGGQGANVQSSESDLLNTEIDHVGVVSKVKKQEFTGNLALAIVACVIGASFQFGYSTGVVNSPADVIQDFYNDTRSNRGHKHGFSSVELTILWSVTVSIFCVGGMIGGVSAGYFANKFGRKGTLLINNIVALLATGLLGCAKLATSYEMLIIGRFVVGVNSGISTGVAPLYLSEIAPLSLRGLSGTFNQFAITFGILVSQVLGLKVVLGTGTDWPIVFGFIAVPVVLQLILLPLCPESPRFLMLTRQDEEEAEKALVWLRKNYDVSDEIEEMRKEAEEQKESKKFTVRDLVTTPELLTPLIISILMQLSQQLSGINAVTYYSTKIFTAAGLSHDAAQYSTVASGGIMVLMTFISALLVDRMGRRTLHLSGLGGMLIFSVLLTIAYSLQNDYSWLSYVCIASVVMFVVSFSAGPGSIPWFIVAELFAQGPRSAAMSVAVLVNWFANFVVGVSFPGIQDAIDEYCFIPFAVLIAVFWLFTFFKVPETKGKTIDEITKQFKPSVEVGKMPDDNHYKYERLQ